MILWEVAMTVGIFEAKQKLSELVERASRGEEIVITRRGRERARLVKASATSKRKVKEILDSFARVRMKLPNGMTVKDLVEEGRRF
jgi:prevent-host-death family protein